MLVLDETPCVDHYEGKLSQIGKAEDMPLRGHLFVMLSLVSFDVQGGTNDAAVHFHGVYVQRQT